MATAHPAPAQHASYFSFMAASHFTIRSVTESLQTLLLVTCKRHTFLGPLHQYQGPLSLSTAMDMRPMGSTLERSSPPSTSQQTTCYRLHRWSSINLIAFIGPVSLGYRKPFFCITVSQCIIVPRSFLPSKAKCMPGRLELWCLRTDEVQHLLHWRILSTRKPNKRQGHGRASSKAGNTNSANSLFTSGRSPFRLDQLCG